MGGAERPGKGSHRVVNFKGKNLSFPRGILKVGLLSHLLKISGVSEEDFLRHL
jgi:hypothetical protein